MLDFTAASLALDALVMLLLLALTWRLRAR